MKEYIVEMLGELDERKLRLVFHFLAGLLK